MVKNLPAMQETQILSLAQEDPLEKGMAIHSSILAWKNLMDRGAWWATARGVARVGHDLATKPPFVYPFHILLPQVTALFSEFLPYCHTYSLNIYS